MLRELEHHEFKLDAVLHDLFEAKIARDSMLDVHDIVAHGKVAKVGDEGRRLRLGPDRRGARGDIGFIGKVVRAKDDEVALGQADARRNGAAHQNRRAEVPRQIAGLVVDVFAARMHGAAAQAVGLTVFTEQTGQPLDLALVGRDQEHARARGGQRLDLLEKDRDRAMKAKRGPR